jgi:hypothetical protein
MAPYCLQCFSPNSLPASTSCCCCSFLCPPRPGAYKTTPSWAQNSPSWQAQVGSKQGPTYTPSTALIGCPVRVPDPTAAAAAEAPSTHAELLLSTPPSIPARHQSYGYEPGPNGSLVMQPPPAHTAPTSSTGKGAAACSSSRAKSPTRPSTVQHSRKGAHASAGGREPSRQLVQQQAAAQEAGQQLQGARDSFR